MPPRPDWTPPPDLLEELALALRADATIEHTTFLDVVEQRVVILTFDPHARLHPPDEGAPAWKIDEHALAEQIVGDPERFRQVVAHGTPGRLRAFLHSVEDRALRDELFDAARVGRGAYRAVRSVLRRRGLEGLWHAFAAAADRELALDWLRSEELLSE